MIGKFLAKSAVYVSYGTLALTWGFIAVLVYWSIFDRSVPVINQLLSVPKSDVYHGQEVIVQYRVLRLRACHTSYERILSSAMPGGGSIVVSTGVRDILTSDVGKVVDVVASFSVPYHLQPGIYEFVTRINYECNPMQRFFPIVVDTPKVFFVVKSADSAHDIPQH